MAWPSSLRSRLTLWFALLLGLPLIGFGLVCYLVFARTLNVRTEGFIRDALAATSAEFAAERRVAFNAEDAMRSTINEVRFRDLHLVIVDRAGRVVVSTPSALPRLQHQILVALQGHDPATPLALTLPLDRDQYRLLAQPLAADGQVLSLTGTYALRDIEAMLAQIRSMFLVAIPILVLCAAGGGYLLARSSLAPVASMAGRAATITASNLDQRLPVGGGDELAGLARVVNHLLDRLEASFVQQRRFVADASHELRTPTAILRTEADVTLSRDHRPETESRASVGVMRDAAQRLTRIVDELFLLARADAGHLVAHRVPLYLEDLVHEVVRAVQGVAEQRSVRIELEQLVEAPVEGDADLLGRLFLNLLDNAIKHSPEGGVVTVAMRRLGPECEVTVTDTGPGVPAAARHQIFERFFRVDAARSRSQRSATSGAGLGLAIARQIADMHGGRLELIASGPGRTEFRFILPIDPAR